MVEFTACGSVKKNERNMKYRLSFQDRWIPYSILLITVSSVNAWTRLPIGNTFLWWAIYLIILFAFYKSLKSSIAKFSQSTWPILFFLFIVLVSFIYGTFIAEYYWDWKLLITNFMVFLLPLAIFPFSSPSLLTRTLKVWLRYAPLMFLPFLLILDSEAYGRYLVPISFILIFYPKLPFKWKFISILTILFIVVTSIDARSNVIKFIIPLIISLLYYLKRFFSIFKVKIILSIISVVLLFVPIVLFFLAVSNIFNVFNMKEYANISENYTQRTSKDLDYEYSLLDDTRSFLYEEEIQSAIKNNYILFGRSMARGYETIYFAGSYKEYQMETKRNDRPDCEVSILNVFNYFGLIGVISYALIFFVAVFKALISSKNIYIPIIGVYVAFRWWYAWVEDFNRFDLNYLFLWITIAMCFSVPFRAMNNKQFEYWIVSLFIPYSKPNISYI
jgi:hypothetical protein